MVSHHLDLLRMSGLVDREQKGREMHYSLNYGKLGTARSFLAKVK
jgi:DNA-binding transcriptional ArsR family regulator